MTKAEVMKMAKASKDLEFVVLYMEKGQLGLNWKIDINLNNNLIY